MDVIKKFAIALGQGELVIFPTETVYGLGADATNSRAIQEVYHVKGRPSYNPLISHVDGIEMAQRYVQFDEISFALAQHYWPGPLTLVLERICGSSLAMEVSGHGKTAGIRCPAHPKALGLIKEFGKPIAAPSANIFGKLSPTCADDLDPILLDKVPNVIDGGPCHVGVESTVVYVHQGQVTILRPGFITQEDLETFLGKKVVLSTTDNTAPKSPGQLTSHYAPNKDLRIDVKEKEATETLIGFGQIPCDINLSEKGDLAECSRNLFHTIRLLDKDASVKKIAISPIPNYGIGVAINDRLKRASQKKGKSNDK